MTDRKKSWEFPKNSFPGDSGCSSQASCDDLRDVHRDFRQGHSIDYLCAAFSYGMSTTPLPLPSPSQPWPRPSPSWPSASSLSCWCPGMRKSETQRLPCHGYHHCHLHHHHNFKDHHHHAGVQEREDRRLKGHLAIIISAITHNHGIKSSSCLVIIINDHRNCQNHRNDHHQEREDRRQKATLQSLSLPPPTAMASNHHQFIMPGHHN